MTLLVLPADDFRFPPVELASREGLLAVGGDLRPERLLEAYRRGIFPWYNPGQPILWWSPDPRAVLLPSEIRISRSLRKALRAGKFRATLDTRFEDVIDGCAAPRRAHDAGTWITRDMRAAYVELHRRGRAHSVEIWESAQLVGGLYGVALGGAFFGESMFSRASDASKVALVHLARQVSRWDYRLIDCQLPSEHLERMGARAIRRARFLALLRDAVSRPEHPPPWRFDEDLNLTGC